jgi:hypothetical protein
LETLKKFQKQITIIAFLVGLLLIVVFLVSIGGSNDAFTSEEITIKQGSTSLSVKANGSVEVLTDNGLFTTQWSKEKTDAFFLYFDTKYKGNDLGDNSIEFSGEGESSSGSYSYDELVETIIEEVTGQPGDSGGTGGSGGSNPPPPGSTPKPPPPTGVGSPGPTQTPKPPPPTGLGGSDPTCLYWALSYCVNFPSPTPTPTAAPGDENVIEAPDCASWNAQSSQATVIGNTVCITQ